MDTVLVYDVIENNRKHFDFLYSRGCYLFSETRPEVDIFQASFNPSSFNKIEERENYMVIADYEPNKSSKDRRDIRNEAEFIAKKQYLGLINCRECLINRSHDLSVKFLLVKIIDNNNHSCLSKQIYSVIDMFDNNAIWQDIEHIYEDMVKNRISEILNSKNLFEEWVDDYNYWAQQSNSISWINMNQKKRILQVEKYKHLYNPLDKQQYAKLGEFIPVFTEEQTDVLFNNCSSIDDLPEKLRTFIENNI